MPSRARGLRCFFGLAALVAACSGASNELVDPGDDLLEPGSTVRRDGGASSSSSGAPSSSSSSGTPSSSSSSGSPQTDSGAGGCDPSWALTAPAAVAGFPAQAKSPSFTASELSVYFLQNVGGSNRVFAATRASMTEPFGAPLELGPNVNSGGSMDHVFVSDDSLALYFSYGNNVYVVTRTETTAAFGAATLARGNARNELVARDASARIYARNADGIAPYALRPADAGEDVAQRLGVNGWPTWYEPSSGTLWVDSYVFTGWQFVFKPVTLRWDGAAWSGPTDSDLAVTWTSRDSCRLYGTTADAVVMRSRVLPP
jgi:hypothetical protein